MAVLGFAWRPSATSSSVPLLYASLPADRLVGRDWACVRPRDLPALGVVRWLPTGACQFWHECEGAYQEEPPAPKSVGSHQHPGSTGCLPSPGDPLLLVGELGRRAGSPEREFGRPVEALKTPRF